MSPPDEGERDATRDEASVTTRVMPWVPTRSELRGRAAPGWRWHAGRPGPARVPVVAGPGVACLRHFEGGPRPRSP